MRCRRLPSCLVALAAASCTRPAPVAVTPAVARVMQGPKDLLWGPCAAGALGDIVMENGNVVAVISQTERASGFAVGPGNLVDLTWTGGEDHLNEVFLYINEDFPRQANYTHVEIASKGGGKKPAIVRAKGIDSKDPRIEIETEYRLEPGGTWLTLVSRFTSSATGTLARYRIGDAIQWGRTQHMAPGHGFNLPGQRVNVDWVAGIGEGTSYALVPDGQKRFDTPSGSMWSDPIGASVDLVPRKATEYVRHIVVGRGDTASLAPMIARLRGDKTGRITGSVLHDGAPISDAVVRVLDDKDQLAGLAHVDRTGWYTIDLAPGRYRAEATAPGRTPAAPAGAPGPVDVAAGEVVSVAFEMGARATIAWRIEGDDGRAPPVKITIVGVDGTTSPDFGPLFRGDGAENYVLSARGLGEIAVGPGRYRVIASRGPEFELVEQIVDAAAGDRAQVAGRLRRAFASPGLIASDLHQHAAPSFDSGVSLPDRALSNAAEGLEVLVATDHNVLTDYGPVIAELGLGRTLISIIGTEATTHTVGHFNALPLAFSPGKLRGGMIDVEGMTPRQIFDFMRGLRPGDIEPFVQVNHPRSGKTTGYFDIMGFDPATGTATDERYADDFDGVEVISFGDQRETSTALADWFALLRRGRRITATGTSDSHTISLREVGWARTHVCVENDDPPHLDEAEFTRSLREGCATTGTGPVVTIAAEDTRMGGLLRAPGGRFSVKVDVYAASWVGTDSLTLFVSGRPQVKVPIQAQGAHRYSATHALECKADCFVAAFVESEKTLAPVLSSARGRTPLPLGLTNPIYVDADGDGRFAPPRAP